MHNTKCLSNTASMPLRVIETEKLKKYRKTQMLTRLIKYIVIITTVFLVSNSAYGAADQFKAAWTHTNTNCKIL